MLLCAVIVAPTSDRTLLSQWPDFCLQRLPAITWFPPPGPLIISSSVCAGRGREWLTHVAAPLCAQRHVIRPDKVPTSVQIKAKQSPFGSLTFLADCFRLFLKVLLFTNPCRCELRTTAARSWERTCFINFTWSKGYLPNSASLTKEPAWCGIFSNCFNEYHENPKLWYCQNDLLSDICVGPLFKSSCCVQFYEYWMLVINIPLQANQLALKLFDFHNSALSLSARPTV